MTTTQVQIVHESPGVLQTIAPVMLKYKKVQHTSTPAAAGFADLHDPEQDLDNTSLQPKNHGKVVNTNQTKVTKYRTAKHQKMIKKQCLKTKQLTPVGIMLL